MFLLLKSSYKYLMTCEEIFYQTYKHFPSSLAFCPYRICPLGAHVDHQLGKVTGMAIDKGIHIAYGPKQNGVVELTSVNFPKRAQFHVASVPKLKENDWADQLRGATIALGRRYPLSIGLCGVIEGTLPIGGLSSSAAVIISFLTALCDVNNIVLTKSEMIAVALEAENDYVGVSCGKLDQSCEVFCKKDELLYLDTKDDSYVTIPQNPAMKLYEIAVFFSGLERSLVGSRYNMRVDECKSAAYALMAFTDMEYGKYKDTYLRDVPVEVFEANKDRLPLTWRKRAEHYYSENARVTRGVEAWRRGDIEEFGRLCFESGRSSIESYEAGSPELKRMYEIMTETEGIYGGRFSGAGFKGCSIAIINPEYREEIAERVEREYLRSFPELAGRFSVHFCKSADGVGGRLR